MTKNVIIYIVKGISKIKWNIRFKKVFKEEYYLQTLISVCIISKVAKGKEEWCQRGQH